MPARARTKYEDRTGTIHFLSLTPEFAAVAGTEPAGDIDSPIKAQVSKTNREHGLRPRRLVLTREVGSAPDNFYKYTYLPLRSIADESNSAYNDGQTITIGSTVWTIVGLQGEDY